LRLSDIEAWTVWAIALLEDVRPFRTVGGDDDASVDGTVRVGWGNRCNSL
jgi:hypothetical protein